MIHDPMISRLDATFEFEKANASFRSSFLIIFTILV